MITHQSPWDYKKKYLIVDQLTRICADCGHFAALFPRGWRCCVCHGNNIVKIMESEVADYRRLLENITLDGAELQRALDIRRFERETKRMKKAALR